mmetsp:Transcript_2050/g.3065  ORF Transcript_2050/g.3065 Transcript_2050/m.3065 type:complete len:112 (+) Transcript_2050:900-1235(+)
MMTKKTRTWTTPARRRRRRRRTRRKRRRRPKRKKRRVMKNRSLSVLLRALGNPLHAYYGLCEWHRNVSSHDGGNIGPLIGRCVAVYPLEINLNMKFHHTPNTKETCIPYHT